MKRLRKIIRISIGILVILTVVGIVLLIINDDLNVFGTSFEIIAFLIGAGGMVLAIISQIDAQYSDKQFSKMVGELDDIREEIASGEKYDKQLDQRLKALAEMDEKIYRKLPKVKRPHRKS
jgi:hypothetical protein